MKTLYKLMRRNKNKRRMKYVASANLPTEFGNYKMYGYEDRKTGQEHVAIVHGDVQNATSVLTRIHSECLTGDALGSLKCDCRSQLIKSLEKISCEEAGIVLYLRQEGRGIGLLNKIKAYNLQDQGYDTLAANLELGLPADAREYDIAADMLDHLGVQSVRLMTNNPDKMAQLEQYGVTVENRVAHDIEPNKYNEGYMKTKNAKFGHMISTV